MATTVRTIDSDETIREDVQTIIALAERLGVEPYERVEGDSPRIVIQLDDASPGYDLGDIVRAVNERLDADARRAIAHPIRGG